MLHKLSIHNYALIDRLDIEFDNGLNIITGETGAGKSIILGALSLILGQRAESRFFFNQDKKCIIEGVFWLDDENLKSSFEKHDLDFAKETLLRREISIDGKSRSFINDTPVTLSILKEIGEQLIDIHSQHATQEINNRDFQLLLLDAVSDHIPLLKKYRLGYQQLKKDQSQLQQLIAQADEARSRQDYEQFLFNELEQAKLIDGEQTELEKELARLLHAESIKKALSTANHLLTDSENAALTILKEVATQFQQAEKFDPNVAALQERLRSCIIEIKDIAEEASTIEQQTLHEEARIVTIQQRLDVLYTLQQKHKVADLAGLLALQQKLEDNLQQLTSSAEEIDALQKSIATDENNLTITAQTLSKNRKKSMKLVSTAIDDTLQKVAMPQAKIDFNHEVRFVLDKDGLDEVTLLFSANAGQGPAPVSKVASGGELSRLMLAIKTLLAKHTALPTLIFDEIDTGISGETALKVGEVMEGLGNDMQIISITHLPQIAAKGKAHYFVYKNELNDKTYTGIRKLEQQDRIEVIAEMLSGKNPGTAALQHAKELLG